MHRVDAYIHTFWVPYRLVMPKIDGTYADWENWIQGDPSENYTNDELPYITLDDSTKSYFDRSTLQDYLGLPQINPLTDTINAAADTDINILPQIAYNLIFDEYYRNPWIQERRAGVGGLFTLEGGDRNASIAHICGLLTRHYERDYFVGAYPEAYRGSASNVELDLDILSAGTNGVKFDRAGGTTDASGAITAISGLLNDGTSNLTFDSSSFLDTVSTLEILELRRAEALVRFLEAENRTGLDRYDEWLKIMFGVQNPDFRDKYPRYLGGGKQVINIREIENQSAVYDSTDTLVDPQGFQVGAATGAGKSGGINFHATEHGCIMTILSVVPRTAYTGGIEKFWTKNDRTEFYNPHFQGIGDQEILTKEINYSGLVNTTNDDVWAYAPRFAEYKQKISTVGGEYGYTGNLQYWHMARIGDPQATNGSRMELNKLGL